MSSHKQVTKCQKTEGPISRHCTCYHCTLSVCEVCGAYEGGLTTDCPGVRVDVDRQKEVHETPLDYTDERGWHQGEAMKNRSPRFQNVPPPPIPEHPDPRTAVTSMVDWTKVDRMQALQHELTLKTIAWVLADRVCEDASAVLTRIEDETIHLRGKQVLEPIDGELLAKLERARIDFRLADQKVQKCDDERNQTSRKLVVMLEQPPLKLVP